MNVLFGSSNKSAIIEYLAKFPGKKAKEISCEETNLGYKLTFKILNSFIDEKVVYKENSKYYLTSNIIESLKDLLDNMLTNYGGRLFFKNRSDFMDVLFSLKGVEFLKDEVNSLVDNWLLQRLDDWYSKYYDLQRSEESKLKSLIGNDKEIEILEVGCGTGRISDFLNKEYDNVVSIDKEKKYVEYVKRKYPQIKAQCYDLKDFKSDSQFDIIVLGWIGLQYQKSIDVMLENIKKLLKNNGTVIILDAYYETEYVQILQKIRPTDMSKTKKLKESLNQKLIEEFCDFNQTVLLNEYTFNTKEEIIETFKIELTLEESHIWTKQDEDTLMQYLLTKDTNTIGEGLYITVVKKSTKK